MFHGVNREALRLRVGYAALFSRELVFIPLFIINEPVILIRLVFVRDLETGDRPRFFIAEPVIWAIDRRRQSLNTLHSVFETVRHI